MPDVIQFAEAIKHTNGEDRTLLVGNGFSAQYFNYANLLEKSGLEPESPIRNLFKKLGTVDFEAVVRALESAALVELAYDHAKHAEELERDAQAVREALVQAVKTTHPEHREELEKSYENASRFIDGFGSVFSLNYDLLLYWVLLEHGNHKDGFGLGQNSVGGRLRGPFQPQAHCSVFNLHGGLHLFQDDIGDVYKALNTGDGVVATISDQIIRGKKMPLYVAEGTSQAKLKKIKSVDYLRHCYEVLRENTANVFVYGHSADENDAHIYDAIFRSGAKHVYFGVHRPNEAKRRQFDARLSKYSKLAGDRIPYTLYDSESANVWGDTTKREEDNQ